MANVEQNIKITLLVLGTVLTQILIMEKVVLPVMFVTQVLQSFLQRMKMVTHM